MKSKLAMMFLVSILTGCALENPQLSNNNAPVVSTNQLGNVNYVELGTVVQVSPITVKNNNVGGIGLGALVGAGTGGVLGSLLGSGKGKILTTTVGVIGGGVVGQTIQNNVNGANDPNLTQGEHITVRKQNGQLLAVDQLGTNIAVGQRVQMSMNQGKMRVIPF